MKPIEAKEALIKTIDEICSELVKRDLYVNVNCYFTDRELEPIGDENIDSASILSATVTVSAAGVDEAAVFEHAIAIDGGDVLNDEIIREATKLRENVKELCDAIDSGKSAKEAIGAMDIEAEEVEAPPAPSNKLYYIGGAVAVAVILLLILLFK